MGEKSLTFVVDDTPSLVHCDDDDVIKTTNMNEHTNSHSFGLSKKSQGKKVRISV